MRSDWSVMQGSTRIAVGVIVVIAAWVVAYTLTPAPDAAGPTIAAATDGAGEREPELSFEEPGGGAVANRGVSGGGGGDGVRVEAGADGDAGAGGVNDDVGSGEAGSNVPAVIPPEFYEYVVRAGDTPDGISRRFYGTRRHWDAILRANPLKDLHRRLRVGMTIRVPKDPGNIQGVPADELAGRGGDDGGGDDGVGSMEYLTYHVKRNDTLTGIAAEIYGRASLWTLIRDANVEQTGPEGTRIRPGMVLRIPPKPAE